MFGYIDMKCPFTTFYHGCVDMGHGACGDDLVPIFIGGPWVSVSPTIYTIKNLNVSELLI